MSLGFSLFRKAVNALLPLFSLLLVTPLVAADAESLAIVPERVSLSGAAARQQLLVLRRLGDQFVGQVSESVTFISGDEKIVRVENGYAVPVTDGKTTITAKVGKHTASAEIEVRGMKTPHAWSFRNHVQSVLAKAGCNSGACHGALAGKGGLKLSLRGYDTERDYLTITRQARGRRIELGDPGRSLILAKPSGGIAHKGGLKLDIDSPGYRILSQWIAAGAQAPRDDDPRLDRLEILPELSHQKPGATQQVIVLAHYSDGHTEDVTQWAMYGATNESVAKIDQRGIVSVTGHGEGAVTAWFGSKIVVARIASAYENQVEAKVFAQARSKARNFVDQMVIDKLESLRLPPSPAASDQEFIRRAYLDTIGVLPTADEARKFLADKSAKKRDLLIEALLARPEFVDYWTYKWSDLLLVSGKKLRPEAIKAYYGWIRKSVASNKPWDHFVREIITSKGSSYENGATNFFAVHQDPQEMTENASQAFLGLSINCARCHNHPLEKWTNDQYYAMANLFSRVRAKGWGGDFRRGDGKRTLYVTTKGDLIQPLTGKPQPPTPLDGTPIAMDDPGDRRIHLANWLTSPENPYFARAITNRVWANFFGVGLVESVDDLRRSNPASNEALLSAAADYLIEQKFDLKALMRVILQSESYQRSSQPLPGNITEKRFYSRYYPRRLMAEVMLDAISQVAAVPTVFKDYDKGTRALQLRDANVDSYFLKTFGRPERVITCECERSAEPTMVQVLHISNGDTINEKLQAKENSLAKQLASGASDESLIEEAYLSALSRSPTPQEMNQLLAIFAESKDVERRVLLEDLYWSILSSREFLFNH